jgi:hypothetical protein
MLLLASCAMLPQNDVKRPPLGKALVYGSVIGLTDDRGYSVVLIRRGPGAEVTGFIKSNEWDFVSQKGFVWTLAPGEYEIYRYDTIEPTATGGTRTLHGYWFSSKGVQQILDLGRKATEQEFQTFDHDTFRVEANKVYYLGEWKLRPRFPFIRDNRYRSDKLVLNQYPNLDLTEVTTLIPTITGDQDAGVPDPAPDSGQQ